MVRRGTSAIHSDTMEITKKVILVDETIYHCRRRGNRCTFPDNTRTPLLQEELHKMPHDTN